MQQLLVEHPALLPLQPHLHEYLQKGLEKLTGNQSSFKASALEIYAESVFQRVSELDNLISSLRLALNFILELTDKTQNAEKIYIYHYENFLIRLSGAVDRAHLLVGTSLLLPSSKLEKFGANKFVLERTATDYPHIHSALKSIQKIESPNKNTRNEIAHSKAFSTRELGLFSATNTLGLEITEEGTLEELMNHYFSRGGVELANLLHECITKNHELITELTPIYAHASNSTPQNL
ncbi:MAG: Cthe_2314 family HEPN domain-containing protein [Pseudomonas sp.]|uniref:Cthe_2314 family HEPN domain-containing protein n=1 Tax=Pseudomonas sp. TaxID=306 RepID=UPI003D105485